MKLSDSWELKKIPIRDYRKLPRLKSPAGYVCLIWDKDYDNRYKIERMNHPATDFGRLKAELPFKTQIAYIAETNNVDASERYLHQRYAKHSASGEWFDLNKAQLWEIRRLTSSRQHDAEDRQREAPFDLEEPLPETHRSERQQSVSLSALMSNNYQVRSPSPESAAAAPQRRTPAQNAHPRAPQGQVKRIPIRDYRKLPRLKSPAGYVCLIRDMDYDNRYKIERMNHPATDFGRLKAELPFKTQIAYIAETNDADASERYLHQRYAKHSARGEWFDLDEAQLWEIRSLTSSRQHDAEDRQREAPFDLEEPLPETHRSERQQPVSLSDLMSNNYQVRSPSPESVAAAPQRRTPAQNTYSRAPQGQGVNCRRVALLLFAASVVVSVFVFAFGWVDNTLPPSSDNRSRNTGSSVSLSTRRPTLTSTKRPTSTPLLTLTSTATDTPTLTSTKRPTSTATDTPTLTATNTDVPTATATDAPTLTSTKRPTSTATHTPPPTATDTDVPTATATDAPTLTSTKRPTATATDTPTLTATNTDVPTATATDAPTLTSTKRPTSTATHTPPPTATDTDVPTATATDAPTLTSTKRPTATATDTPTLTATHTPPPTATDTDVPTATATDMPTLTSTKRPTSTATDTPPPTATTTDAPTLTSTKRPTSTATDTPTLTATDTDVPTATATDTPTLTATHTPPPTATDTDVPTATATDTPTLTATDTDVPTATATDTRRLTLTQTTTSSQTSTATKVAGATLYVSTRNNMSAFVRACPRTSCNVVGGLEHGAKIQSVERVVGEMVYGSDEWVKFNHGDATAYIHSELISRDRPSQ